MSATIFLSVVSSEFHHKDPQRPQSFESYRDILTRSLRRQIPGCEVIVQEELKQGYGDLLHTLDDEVRRSTVVIHLIGDTAGATPEPAELRRLRERHPEFLAHQPELSQLLTHEADISYTQWEAYLAFQHDRARLVFTADRTAPRSLRFLPDEQQRASQKAHLQRIERTGEHRQPCYSQADIAVKAVVAIERRGLNPTQPTHAPAADNVSGANAARGEIIAGFVAALRQSVKAAITEYDPAGVESYLKSLDPIVSQYGLTRQFLLNLIAEETELRRRTAEAEPTAENLYDLAFAELTLGNYHDAMVAVIQSIDEETRLMTADHARHDDHRDRVLSGHLLWRDAAEYAGLRAEVLRAMENGARFIDRDSDPILWADFHETIAEDCLKYAHYERAEMLIDDILDIREEHQPESFELARSLLVWCSLLYAKANFDGLLGVARRAEGIFASQSPLIVEGITSSLNYQALGLSDLARYAKAEPLYRRALALAEATYGPDDPNVADSLNNLAALLEATDRHAEAEPLFRRALAIREASFGADDPTVAQSLNNLAVLLKATDRPAEAEPLYRRALAIDEASFGPDHPAVATDLNNLGLLLMDTNRLADAEPLLKRAIVIQEANFGPIHPQMAQILNNLGQLLLDTNRLADAEPLLRRALVIQEANFRPDHPNVATALNSLAHLLKASNRLADAEPLWRRAVEIVTRSLGPDHPDAKLYCSNLELLLKELKGASPGS